MDSQEVARRITQARELRGQSLSALAEQAGIAKSYLFKLESGAIESPGVKPLFAVAQALGLTLAELLDLQESQATSTGKALDGFGRESSELPRGLKEFIDEWEEERGERLPADVIHSLATIQFRGKRPKTSADWRFVYDAVMRAVE